MIENDNIECLISIAGEHDLWKKYKKLETDTREIVVERAAMALNTEFQTLRDRNSTFEAFVAKFCDFDPTGHYSLEFEILALQAEAKSCLTSDMYNNDRPTRNLGKIKTAFLRLIGMSNQD